MKRSATMNLQVISRICLRTALVVAIATAAAAARANPFFLKAAASSITMPDGRMVPVWGYASCDATFTTCGPVSVPGPALVVPDTDTTVTITVQNELPAPTSLVIPSQAATLTPTFVDASDAPVSSGARLAGDVTSRVRSFSAEAGPFVPGGTAAVATYVFPAFAAGTYLYQSGTDPAVQVQMGLYGAITKDAAPGSAYPGRAYAAQATVVLSEIDPAVHDAVAAGAAVDLVRYRPTYFLVNGQSYVPGAAEIAVGTSGQAGPTLLRFLNAGLESRVPVVLGVGTTVIAEDGRPYADPRPRTAPLLAPAQTLDVLATFPAAGRYAVYDRRLGLTTGVPAPGRTPFGGGAFAYLRFAEPPPVPAP
jgi:FtsP/CotA-like multicopper oxidase with cupredoxin domain